MSVVKRNRLPRLNGRRGFSLIELLIAASLIPVVSFAVFSNFRAGVGLWKALHVETPNEDLSLFDRKVMRDFDNAFFYTPLPAIGTSESFTFVAQADVGSFYGASHGIVQVSYFYDASQRALFRRQLNQHEIYKEKPGNVTRLLKDIRSVEMEYFFIDEFKEHIWDDVWADPAKMPIAVRVSFDTMDGESRTKVFPLRAGGGGS